MSDRSLLLPEWAHRGDPHESCDINPCGVADCTMREETSTANPDGHEWLGMNR